MLLCCIYDNYIRYAVQCSLYNMRPCLIGFGKMNNVFCMTRVVIGGEFTYWCILSLPWIFTHRPPLPTYCTLIFNEFGSHCSIIGEKWIFPWLFSNTLVIYYIWCFVRPDLSAKSDLLVSSELFNRLCFEIFMITIGDKNKDIIVFWNSVGTKHIHI